MINVILSAWTVVFAAAGVLAAQETAPRVMSIDDLLSITSVVGGETPQWHPGGSRILFRSGLEGFMTISPDGGFPRRLPIQPGAAGHFLASQSPRYSPNGRWISYVSDKGGSPELWIWSTETGRERQLTALQGVSINSYSWSPDSRWIAFAAMLYGRYDIWKVRIPAGDVRRLTNAKEYEVYPSWSPDSRHILYVRLDEDWENHDIIEISAEGSQPRVVATDTDFFDYSAGGTFGYPLVSPDGRSVLFRSHRSGWINYWIAPRAGGEPRQVAAEESDQSNASWSPDSRFIAFTSNRNGTHSLRLAALDGGPAQTLVSPPGMGVVADPAWSPNGTRISYTFGTPTRPSDLFVVSVVDGAVRQLTVSLPHGGLDRLLVEPRKISYLSSDGLTISAYLYTPPGLSQGGRAPAIIWAHGGPTSQYHDTFQEEVQFFVQRGYVALLPNFRGSSGYGKDFEDANYQCWGHCDLADVLAGVEYLRRLHFVDPARMGITGSSYGGFMTCAATTFARDVFQAAVARSGYCNRVSFMEDGEIRHLKQLAYNFGPFEHNREVYYRNSPFFYIANITTPVFLIHGEGRSPESPQFREFAKEMERHYKTFRYKTFPNENYYVRSRENRRQMLLDMLEFFDHYLGLESGPLVDSP